MINITPYQYLRRKRGTSIIKTDSLEIRVIANCPKGKTQKLLKENETLCVNLVSIENLRG